MTDLREDMLEVAKRKDVEPTKYFDRVVLAKTLMKIGLDCPCAKDDRERYCISDKCFKEIQDKGECHCHCWKRKDENNSR